MTTNTLKALLKVKEFIAAPGVFDMVSAKLALSSASPADAPGNGHRQHCNQRDENGQPRPQAQAAEQNVHYGPRRL
jgi:hypothetical protein